MEEINLKEFFNYYKKYILIVILSAFIFGASIALYDKIFKLPKYTTSTTIVLVKDENSTGTNSTETINQSDINLNQKLVATYRQIVKSKLVLEQVINKLNLDYSYEKLYKEIKVEAVEDTEILKISVTDADSKLAAEIANKLASVFETEITQIYKINNVSVIDKAVEDDNPSNNTFTRDVILAVFLAVAGSSAIIFVVFYFDDTLRNTENIESEIELPVIAKVFKDTNNIDLIVEKKPKSVTSENIRTLRANLQFSSIDNELKTILVTSTLPGEGKSYISANLATSFAQAGKKVLVIDCDLRKGRQHRIFNTSSKRGLSNLLISDKSYKEYISQTKIENLFVIPRGVVPPNPSELLGSKKNVQLINDLKKYFDIIILDGAPVTGISDSLILSSFVDKVLIVSSINHTPKTELKNTKKALENVGANIAGLVINNINSKTDSYGSYYYYNYGYEEKSKK